MGGVPSEHILEWYHRAWLFVLPCVDTPDGNRDGIPNVLMEAMATGLPVITTTNSGQSELIENGEHGLLIPQRSPEKLADAIETLCTNMELRQRIQLNARRRVVECFDSRQTIAPLLELLERVLKTEEC